MGFNASNIWDPKFNTPVVSCLNLLGLLVQVYSAFWWFYGILVLLDHLRLPGLIRKGESILKVNYQVINYNYIVSLVYILECYYFNDGSTDFNKSLFLLFVLPDIISSIIYEIVVFFFLIRNKV